MNFDSHNLKLFFENNTIYHWAGLTNKYIKNKLPFKTFVKYIVEELENK